MENNMNKDSIETYVAIVMLSLDFMFKLLVNNVNETVKGI
jgi:hypothetical protein